MRYANLTNCCFDTHVCLLKPFLQHAFASSKALEETVECQEENVVHAMFSYGGGNESSDSDFDSAQPPPCSGSIAPGMLNVMETCALPQARSEVSAAGAFKKRAAPKRAAPKRAAGIFGGASRARFSGSNHIRAMEAEMDEEEESGEEGSMDDMYVMLPVFIYVNVHFTLSPDFTCPAEVISKKVTCKCKQSEKKFIKTMIGYLKIV